MPRLTTASHGLFSTLFPAVALSIFILLVLLIALRFLAPREALKFRAAVTSRPVLLALGLVSGVLYVLLAWTVLTFPGFIDPGEPLIAATAYFSTHHQSVYHLFIPYGPLCFLPYGLALSLFGAKIGVLKGVVLAANLILLLLLYRLLRKYVTAVPAFTALGLTIAAFMMKQVYLLQMRGDLFIYVAVVIAMFAALSLSAPVALVLLIAALTLAMGAKVTALLYLLYPCALVLQRHGLKSLALAGVITAFLILAPFLLPGISLHAYLLLLHQMSGELRSTKELAGNVLTAVIALVPCVLSYLEFSRRDQKAARLYLREKGLPFACGLFGMAAVIVLAGKFGAGRHHLIPFFLISTVVCVDMLSRARNAKTASTPMPLPSVFAWGSLVLLFLITEASQLKDQIQLARLERPQVAALTADVQSIMHHFPDQPIEIAPGHGITDLDRQYSPMYAAPLLVFSGDRYTFDPSTVADMEVVKVPPSAADLSYLASCTTPVWIAPRGQEPFDTVSIYTQMYPKAYPNHHIFTGEEKAIFSRTYKRTGSTRFFDIYECRSKV